MGTCRKLNTRHWRGKDLRSALREDSMTNSSFDLSLVICTRNRATQLAETLKSVSTIRSQLNWELVVVDNGSTDRTSGVVAEYAASCDHPVQMIVEQGRGVSCAKNAGWQSANSGIVVCIDDDCYPAQDYLDSIFECFSNDPKLGFVGGRILLHDPTDRRITIQESLEPLCVPPGSFIRPGLIQGANARLSARRSCRGRWLRSVVWRWSTLQWGGSGIDGENLGCGLVRCVRSQTSCLPSSRTKNRKR